MLIDVREGHGKGSLETARKGGRVWQDRGGQGQTKQGQQGKQSQWRKVRRLVEVLVVVGDIMAGLTGGPRTGSMKGSTAG